MVVYLCYPYPLCCMICCCCFGIAHYRIKYIGQAVRVYSTLQRVQCALIKIRIYFSSLFHLAVLYGNRLYMCALAFNALFFLIYPQNEKKKKWNWKYNTIALHIGGAHRAYSTYSSYTLYAIYRIRLSWFRFWWRRALLSWFIFPVFRSSTKVLHLPCAYESVRLCCVLCCVVYAYYCIWPIQCICALSISYYLCHVFVCARGGIAYIIMVLLLGFLHTQNTNGQLYGYGIA